MNPIQFKEAKSRIFLEQQIDETIKHITKTIITHTSSRLIETCTDLRDALHDLFDSYDKNMSAGHGTSTEHFQKSKNEFIRKTNSIRKIVSCLLFVKIKP